MQNRLRSILLHLGIVIVALFSTIDQKAVAAEPLFLDMGGFGIYRLNQDELNMLTDEHIMQAYETYARRYFAAFMYITRNIVSIEVHKGYSPTIVDPVIVEFGSLSPQERRERIYALYLDPMGLRKENQWIFERVVKLVDEWDQKKGLPRIEILKPDHDPQDIRKIYLRKLGLPDKAFIVNTAEVENPILIKIFQNFKISTIMLLVFVIGLGLGFGISKFTRKK